MEAVARFERMNAHRKDIAKHIETLFRPIQEQLRKTHEEELRKAQSDALKTNNGAAMLPVESEVFIRHTNALTVARAQVIADAYSRFQEPSGQAGLDDLIHFHATTIAARKGAFQQHVTGVAVRTGRNVSMQLPALLVRFERETGISLLEGKSILAKQDVSANVTAPASHPAAEEPAMSPEQIVVATRSLANVDTSRLGVLLWFLIHADTAMSGLKSTRIRVNSGSTLSIYRDQATEFGREVGRDEIDWWINRKETDLAEFSKRAALALKSAQVLKESSHALKKIDVERYEELVEWIKAFAAKHSEQITAVLEFASWLHSRNPLAPTILFTYKVWGSTRLADRIAPITWVANSPEEEGQEVMERLIETAWGFQSRGLYTYVHAAFDIAADFYDDPSKRDLPIPASRVVRWTARQVIDECATFFEFLRNSLRDIEKELEERSARETRITSELFWKSFVEKARKSAKVEPLTWDFKETLSFWHAANGDARRIEKTKFASDIASFANAEGGCLIVGITDSRKVVGVSNDLREVENRLTSTHQAIREHFSYPRDICRILQVSLADDDNVEKICFVVAVPKACEPAAATDGKGAYIYPQRTGSGTIKADKDQLLNARIHIKNDSYGFLDDLDQFVSEQK
jgi:hypothetical protein